jgi:hypothetical protein
MMEFRYEGDGYFRDYGPEAATYRYLLTLDEYSSSGTSNSTFEIGQLPQTEFYLGYQIGPLNRNKVFEGPDGAITPREDLATVSLRVTEKSSGKVLFEKKGPISEWEIADIVNVTSGPTSGSAMNSPMVEAFITSDYVIDGANYNPVAIEHSLSAPDDQDIRLSLVLKGGGWK